MSTPGALILVPPLGPGSTGVLEGTATRRGGPVVFTERPELGLSVTAGARGVCARSCSKPVINGTLWPKLGVCPLAGLAVTPSLSALLQLLASSSEMTRAQMGSGSSFVLSVTTPSKTGCPPSSEPPCCWLVILRRFISSRNSVNFDRSAGAGVPAGEADTSVGTLSCTKARNGTPGVPCPGTPWAPCTSKGDRGESNGVDGGVIL